MLRLWKKITTNPCVACLTLYSVGETETLNFRVGTSPYSCCPLAAVRSSFRFLRLPCSLPIATFPLRPSFLSRTVRRVRRSLPSFVHIFPFSSPSSLHSTVLPIHFHLDIIVIAFHHDNFASVFIYNVLITFQTIFLSLFFSLHFVCHLNFTTCVCLFTGAQF